MPLDKKTLLNFNRCPEKHRARRVLVRVYRHITGHYSVPSDRQYWCLSGRQTQHKNSEISQLLDMGFITIDQFHGVDYNEDVLNKNRRDHPAAHWHYGDWLSYITTHRGSFHPAVIHLDTMNISYEAPAADITSRTMLMCPVGTVLFANVMLNNPRSHKRYPGYAPDAFMDQLEKRLGSDRNFWKSYTQHYRYTSRKTPMGVFTFQKGVRH